jgi:hypothetical protein
LWYISTRGGRAAGEADVDQAAADLDLVGRHHRLTERGHLTIDADLAGGDPFLHLAARSDPGLGQYLLQALRLGLGNQGLPLRPTLPRLARPVSGGPGPATMQVSRRPRPYRHRRHCPGSRGERARYAGLSRYARRCLVLLALAESRNGVRLLVFMIQLQCLTDLFERRQFAEAAQAQVVEKLLRGGIQRRPARGVAMADDVDPAAFLERLDHVG